MQSENHNIPPAISHTGWHVDLMILE